MSTSMIPTYAVTVRCAISFFINLTIDVVSERAPLGKRWKSKKSADTTWNTRLNGFGAHGRCYGDVRWHIRD